LNFIDSVVYSDDIIEINQARQKNISQINNGNETIEKIIL
jgi:hypothetical protein